MTKTPALLLLLTVLALPPASEAGITSSSPMVGGAKPVTWSVRLAKSEIARRGEARPPEWDYTEGLFAHAIILLGERVEDPKMLAYATKYIGGVIQSDGTIAGYALEEYNLDSVAPGRAVLDLFERTGDARYRKAAALLRQQFVTQPRTSEGGFWHKRRYPQQMWLDGLYMGGPFYAYYGRLFNEPGALDDVAKQILLMDAHAYDAKAGLHYHAWDEAHVQSWASKDKGTSPCFWGRAIGWYAMALVDVLDYLPASHPRFAQVASVLERVAEGIARYQDPKTGLWYQIVNQGGRPGNYLEATASSMFVYTLSKAINRGYLPRDRYLPTVQRGYDGLVRDLVKTDPDGKVNLIQCCEVAGLGYTNSAGRPRDGTYAYYLSEPVVTNDLKGVGPFILAGLEVDRLLSTP